MAHLNTVRINNTVYSHEICLETDATFLKDNCDRAIFKVSSDAYVYDAKNDCIGKFRLDKNFHWEYHPVEGEMIKTPYTYLIEAEEKIFKILLGNQSGN